MSLQLEDSDFEGLDDAVQQMNHGPAAAVSSVGALSEEQKRERNRRRREKRKKAKQEPKKPHPHPVSFDQQQPQGTKQTEAYTSNCHQPGGDDDILDMSDSKLRRIKLKMKMAERLKASRMTRLTNQAIGAFTTKHKGSDEEGEGGAESKEDELSREISEQAQSTSIAGQKISKRQIKRSAKRMPPGVYETKMKHMTSGGGGSAIAPGVLDMVAKKLIQASHDEGAASTS